MKLLMKKSLYLSSLLVACILSTGCLQHKSTAQVTRSTAAPHDTLLVYGDVRGDIPTQFVLDFPAKIIEVKVQNGDLVNKGDILLTLDYSDYLFEIENKERLIQSYEIELKGLGANVNAISSNLSALQDELAILEDYKAHHTNPEIISLESTLKTKEASLALLKQTYLANKELFAAGGLSAHELETSKQAYETLEAEITSTQNTISQLETSQNIKISNLKSQIESTSRQSQNADTKQSNEIELLKLKLETAQAELRQMKSKLNKPYLKDNALIAPSDHLIIRDLSCMNGAYIAGSSTPLLSTFPQDSIYVSADIPEESLSLVKEGLKASIVAADANLASEPITGTLTCLSKEAILKDGDTMVEAKLTLDNGQEVLKPGLNLDITFELTND